MFLFHLSRISVLLRVHKFVSVSASLGLNDEQKHIQTMATDFAKNELFPNMSKWDQEVSYRKWSD